MTKEQLKALIAYVKAEIDYGIESAFGRDTSYSWSDQMEAEQKLYEVFGFDWFERDKGGKL